jgi:hypothetical protein
MAGAPKEKPADDAGERRRDPVTWVVAGGLLVIGVGGVLAVFWAPLAALVSR